MQGISQCQRVITIPYSQVKIGPIVSMKVENYVIYNTIHALLDLTFIYTTISL